MDVLIPSINPRHSIFQVPAGSSGSCFPVLLPKAREAGIKPVQEEGRIKPQQEKTKEKEAIPAEQVSLSLG